MVALVVALTIRIAALTVHVSHSGRAYRGGRRFASVVWCSDLGEPGQSRIRSKIGLPGFFCSISISDLRDFRKSEN